MLVDSSRSQLKDRAEELRPQLEKYFEVVSQVDDFSADLPTSGVDLAVVLGGDGSILRAAHQMGYHQLPVLGVNLGRLGFLADVLPEQLDEVLPRVVAGDYYGCFAPDVRVPRGMPGEETLRVSGSQRRGSASRPVVRDARSAALR